MCAKSVWTALIVGSLAFAAVYSAADQVLVVREGHAGVVTLDPNESFYFPFNIFGVAADLRFSLVLESGPPIGVCMFTEHDYELHLAGMPWKGPGFCSGQVTTLFGAPGFPEVPEGVYRVLLTYEGDEPPPSDRAPSVVRFDLTSVGHPTGSLGAGVHLGLFFVWVFLFLALFGGLVLLAEATPLLVGPFCPYCGRRSSERRCPYCGLPPLLIWSRKC